MGALISQLEQSNDDDDDDDDDENVLDEDETESEEQQIESAICDTRYGMQESR